MPEALSPPAPPRPGSMALTLAVLLHLAVPAALLAWVSVGMLLDGGVGAAAGALSGMLWGFGLVGAVSTGLLTLTGMLLRLCVYDGSAGNVC